MRFCRSSEKSIYGGKIMIGGENNEWFGDEYDDDEEEE